MTDIVEQFISSIRPIDADDFHRGYERLFSTLSTCPPYTKETFIEILETRKKQGWLTWVLEDNKDDKTIIIATTSLMLERKIYREGRNVGHIEDVIVLPEYQHHKLGTHLNEFAISECERLGCYKVILDCKPELENFYNKAGLHISNIQMAKYF